MVFFRLNMKLMPKQLHGHIPAQKFQHYEVLMIELLKVLLLKVQVEPDKSYCS